MNCVKATIRRLFAGEPRGYANLFCVTMKMGLIELMTISRRGGPANALFWDATPDLGRVVFSEGAELTPEAAPGGNESV